MAPVRKIEAPLSSYGERNLICLIILKNGLFLQWIKFKHMENVSKCNATEMNK
jgi:hypothetical protein